MKVGIMGGTFDPVHNGHIRFAQAALEALGLDRVMLLPAGDPPHKLPQTLKQDRFRMARLAAQDCPGLFACDIEIFREGTTYTVDTLTELRRDNPDTQWVYLIGADTLDVLESWRSFPKVAQMCAFAVAARAEEDVDSARIRRLRERFGARIEVLPFRGPEISSSEIRRKVARGEPISNLVPGAVEAYIREKGLYLCGMSKAGVLEALKASLKPARYEHTLGVAETARRLAPACGVEPCRAELAGLLHDCAKSMPLEEMRALVRGRVPDLDEEELATASVLHAPAGSVLAAEKYGVQDPSILSAIRRHTLGAADMSPMDALIYTADFIEPNRKPFPELAGVRRLAEKDIYAAMYRCAELTEEYVKRQGGRPHPRTLEMLAKRRSK